MDWIIVSSLNILHDATVIAMGCCVFSIIGPWVFKKIGEWFTLGASIGGLKVLQKINTAKEVKGEKKDEKENEKVRK